jgi:hypothetical protein
MDPVHVQVLEAARSLAAADGTFRIADVVRALPHLNAATVRTHVASRCTVNAPANHQSRHRYFRALRRGVYRIEARWRPPAQQVRPRAGSQDRILATLDSGIDASLIAESLAMTPTERIEVMRRAALSLDEMNARRPEGAGGKRHVAR